MVSLIADGRRRDLTLTLGSARASVRARRADGHFSAPHSTTVMGARGFCTMVKDGSSRSSRSSARAKLDVVLAGRRRQRRSRAPAATAEHNQCLRRGLAARQGVAGLDGVEACRAQPFFASLRPTRACCPGRRRAPICRIPPPRSARRGYAPLHCHQVVRLAHYTREGEFAAVLQMHGLGTHRPAHPSKKPRPAAWRSRSSIRRSCRSAPSSGRAARRSRAWQRRATPDRISPSRNSRARSSHTMRRAAAGCPFEQLFHQRIVVIGELFQHGEAGFLLVGSRGVAALEATTSDALCSR